MNSARAWIVYSSIRLLAFALPCAIIMFALPGWEWNWVLGVAVGMVVSALVSYLFLRGPRSAMVAGMAQRRERRDERGADELAEDADLERAAESSLEREEESLEREEESRDAAQPPRDGEREPEDDLEDAFPHHTSAEDLREDEPVEQAAPDPEDLDIAASSSMELAPDDERRA